MRAQRWAEKSRDVGSRFAYAFEREEKAEMSGQKLETNMFLFWSSEPGHGKYN